MIHWLILEIEMYFFFFFVVKLFPVTNHYYLKHVVYLFLHVILTKIRPHWSLRIAVFLIVF